MNKGKINLTDFDRIKYFFLDVCKIVARTFTPAVISLIGWTN